MITLYHGSNVQITDINLAQCNPYKDFGKAFYLTSEKSQAPNVQLKNCSLMNVSEQEFKFMTEGITSDLIQLLIDREHYTLPQAVEAVYKSDIYAALLRPGTGLYAQSSGYVYQYLDKELKNQ